MATGTARKREPQGKQVVPSAQTWQLQ
ncbi:MAG: hypothetical protein QOJ51_4342, partial [Acidobacteriaceae bacterium]|nr:hypothetical protein [Acidobacteriaceae bacterium]